MKEHGWKTSLPPILIALSLMGGGLTYKDGEREIFFWFSNPTKGVELQNSVTQ